MALGGRAVAAQNGAHAPTRLKRFAARFSKIVQPSETVTTSLYGEGTIHFETTSDNGNTAIKDGLAEVA
jgi:hypothetical protein